MCPRRPSCGRGALEAVELDPSLKKAGPTADMQQPRQGWQVGKREQRLYSEALRGCPQGGGSSPAPGSTGRQGRGAAPFLSGLTLQFPVSPFVTLCLDTGGPDIVVLGSFHVFRCPSFVSCT